MRTLEWYGRLTFVAALAIVSGEISSAQAQTVVAAAIAGHVTDTHSVPVSRYSVIVFPTDRAQWSVGSRVIQIAGPDADGGFEVAGLAPGAYWVVAVNAVQGEAATREWLKPEQLETLSTRATRVVLSERQHVLTVLRVITR